MPLVTLDEVKEFLTVDYDVQDTTVGNLIAGCVDWVGRICGIEFTRAEYIEHLNGGGEALWPTHRPVASVSEVYDMEGTVTEATDNYILLRDRIYYTDYTRWDQDRPGQWRVTYTGGYADGSVPGGIKAAILQLVTRWFENRSGKSVQSAAGYGVTWSALADSDVWAALEPYMQTGGVSLG